ncbi:hypothetical protein [Actinoallomurus iriomotensis]|uniref:hypothetical protein n=1 Tax=Actinoallomurus iriomotensis TaxID=478107 RepID=UPI0025549C78|nr:hypothetical protein [Actinoallomurus iriomotensis]
MNTGTGTSTPAPLVEGRRAVAVVPPALRAADVLRAPAPEVFDAEVLARLVVPPRPAALAADVLVDLPPVVLPPALLPLVVRPPVVLPVVVLPPVVLLVVVPPLDVLLLAVPPPEVLEAEVLLLAEALRDVVFSLVARPASAIPAHPPSGARTRCPVKSRLYP